MRYLFSVLLIIGSLVLSVSGQTAGDLRKSLTGKRVTLRIDIPANDGVNVYPERSQSLDYSEYTDRLKEASTTIKRGEVATITDLCVDHKKIEVEFADQHNQTSSFNIRFQRLESWMLISATVIDALNRYVEFTDSDKHSAQLKSPTETAAGYVRNGVTWVREQLI